MSDQLFYTIFYCLISGSVIYPPAEFVSAGLTIKDMCSSWLNNEDVCFIDYHVRRIVATLAIHSMLPFGYILGSVLFGHVDVIEVLSGRENPIWLLLIIFSIAAPLYVLFKVLEWRFNMTTHPIVKGLSVYCDNNTTWRTIATDINREYRRVDKIIININSINRIIVTDNWILKVTPYNVQIARQDDTALIVNKSDTHLMSPATRGEVQFINIQVKPIRAGAQPFDIRLNALDFKNLQDKVSRPIVILQNVTVYKSLLDRFIDTFKEQAEQNPIYNTTEELDQCIGCMQATSNVKLSKHCISETESRIGEECRLCRCRPMWCIECMAKWFASRQDENMPETWLSSKCTCPTCGSKFCVLDVSYVQRE